MARACCGPASTILFCALLACFCTSLVVGTCDVQCPNKNYGTLSSVTDDGVLDDLLYYFNGGVLGRPPPEFTAKAPPNLLFDIDANLTVAYVWEDTGYVSQLGYFVYTLNSSGDAIITAQELLFDVVRDINSTTTTKCLTRGDSVTAPRTFKAGERVGFYLVADGACDPGGKNTWYSVEQLNVDHKNFASRHVATYIDNARELLILGFEDLPWSNSGNDKDYNDAMFVFDTRGASVSFDAYPFGCTKPHCQNGDFCNYTTGRCDCPSPWTGSRCELCACDDNNACTIDSCAGYCNQTRWNETCAEIATCSFKSITAGCITTATIATTSTTGNVDITSTTDRAPAASTGTTTVTTTNTAGSTTGASNASSVPITSGAVDGASPFYASLALTVTLAGALALL